MKLIVWELGLDGVNESLKETYSLTKDTDLYAVRAHLMIYGAPAGTVYMQIWHATENKVIKQSDSHTITSLKSNTYAHGMYRFVFNVNLKSGTYRFVLRSSGGYSYSSSAFVGWCAHRELRRVSTPEGTEEFGGFSEPKGLEFWEYNKLNKGIA